MEPWKNLSLEDVEGEVWVDVVGYEKLHQVSSVGRFKSLKREVHYTTGQIHIYPEMILSQCLLRSCGYLYVALTKDKKHKNFRAHIIVAKHFIPNPLNLPEVNHLKSIKTDNRVSELEWSTHPDNILHHYRVMNNSNWKKGKMLIRENGSKTWVDRVSYGK